MGAIGGSSVNGGTITSGVLSLAPADGINGGIVTTGTQTFGGKKIFISDLTVNDITVGKGAAGISTNTSIGASALSSNTTGSNNTSIGASALSSNTTGSGNTANGPSALQANISGNNNTASGLNALQANITGVQNTANGVNALFANTASFNTANGANALNSNTLGNNNTANGRSALTSNTTGDNNTATGFYALQANTTGSNNTAIGKFADVATGGLTNATAIGHEATVTASNSIQLGNGNVTNVKTSGSITAGAITYPNTAGTNGYYLKTDGSGTASWAASSFDPTQFVTMQAQIATLQSQVEGLINPSVTIGTQVWTTRNLNISSYRNGDLIPEVTDLTTWAGLTTGAWCYYNNDPANGAIYGKLYNWYAVNDPRGLAPEGYHIPSKAEQEILTNFLGATAGTKLKATTGWPTTGLPYSGNGSNSAGFSALPGGVRYQYNGSFDKIGNESSFWSATTSDSTNAWLLNLTWDTYSNAGMTNKGNGFSIRCIKD
jgi:uncharacterized protein (TIGR02145 family)